MNVFINEKVSLATAERSKQWFDEEKAKPVKFRGRGRRGTLWMSLQEFASRVGAPHESVPQEHWQDYENHDLLDGAGKVSARWFFDTPRGLVDVHDYWWNQKDELSVGCTDRRAMAWFRRWCSINVFVYSNR